MIIYLLVGTIVVGILIAIDKRWQLRYCNSLHSVWMIPVAIITWGPYTILCILFLAVIFYYSKTKKEMLKYIWAFIRKH